MGRIRTIKPELLTDGKAAGLSDCAWRLWVSSWLLADDLGRFPAEPVVIAGQMFPGRDLSEVSCALTEVSNAGLIKLYSVNKERYGQITGWSKHQKINRPSGPKFPAPYKEFSEDSKRDHGALDADHDRRFSQSEDRLTEESLRNDPFQPKPDRASIILGRPPVDPKREIFDEDLESAYQRYPLKKGKAKGLAAAKRTIKTLADFELFARCIEHMATAFARDKTYCPHFSTFVNGKLWRDEQWPSPGKSPNATGAISFMAGIED